MRRTTNGTQQRKESVMRTFYTALIMSALCAGAALAQPVGGDGFGPGGRDGKERPGRAIAGQLELTPEQQKALRVIRQEFHAAAIDLRANIEKARLEVQSLMTADTVNREAIMTAVEKEGAATTALRKAMVEQHLKVREIVGPEKAAQMMETMQNRRGGGMRGPHGFPPTGDEDSREAPGPVDE
jgi:Spy/CpxP family protein refolding chaperone